MLDSLPNNEGLTRRDGDQRRNIGGIGRLEGESWYFEEAKRQEPHPIHLKRQGQGLETHKDLHQPLRIIHQLQ